MGFGGYRNCVLKFTHHHVNPNLSGTDKVKFNRISKLLFFNFTMIVNSDICGVNDEEFSILGALSL